jgi:hypothetical protein
MNIVQALRSEAKKLEERLDRVRGAITALNGAGPGRKRGGYKLSKATRAKMSRAAKKNWMVRRQKQKSKS